MNIFGFSEGTLIAEYIFFDETLNVTIVIPCPN